MKLSELTRKHGEAGTKKHGDDDQAAALRRMLLAMANDLRVVLLRLASRLQTLRYYAESKQPGPETIARETMRLYAPLANRLGIWQLKWELEDLSFRFLEPETYKDVARLLDEKRIERQDFIEHATKRVQQLLSEAGITADVVGRPKHIYSIVNKMRTKRLTFDQVRDVRGLRVIVQSMPDCYQALSAIHQEWTAVAGDYDDYIARPKAERLSVAAHGR